MLYRFSEMEKSNKELRCAMVQSYCSEQIVIPECFPNILKTYAKAAIRTQPYDILRWSAAYFRCLANKEPPPVKMRLERDCREGSLTKGYLKVLVAQDDLSKYLSLCRMLNWPQVHWLKVLSVMIGSLCETLHDTMTMVCEILTDDVDGGLARIPYWMFKICYTFVAKLECSQEQCFVNGQKVLPWGDLEEAPAMEGLPRVLSASLLKDTIITSCKAKFQKPLYGECKHPFESSSGSTMSTDFTFNYHFDDPKELLDKCEDFDTIMLLLHDVQEKPLSEEDFKEPHYITVKQLAELKDRKQHQKQEERTEEIAYNHLQQEALQMLREVGPPWTWLYHFSNTAAHTASYNFIDQESIIIDDSPENTSVESFDFTKKLPEIDKDLSSTSTEIAIKKNSLESLRALIENATNKKKCNLENTFSVISYLKSEEADDLQRYAEPFKPPLNLDEICRVLKEADSSGIRFTDIGQLMRHIHVSLLGNVADFPTTNSTRRDLRDDISLAYRSDDSISIPHEWEDKIPKQIVVPPIVVEEKKPKLSMADPKPPARTDTTKIFENTVGMPPEPASKTPKFCYDSKDEDELVLGLVPLSKPSELVEEEENIGSALLETDTHSGEGYQQDDFEFHAKEVEGGKKLLKAKVAPDDMRYYCCVNGSTQNPTLFVPPSLQFHCTINSYPGIGAPVSQKTIDDFLGFLRVRARSQRGLIHPRNFKEERCPYLVDSTPMH